MDQNEQDALWGALQKDSHPVLEQSAGRIEYLLRIAQRLRSGGRLLDIGVGDGALLRRAEQVGYECYAVDPSPETIQRLGVNAKLADRARVARMDALPFPDGHFDVVTASEVLEHVADDVLEASLAEVRRVLTVGGFFLGTTPARENLAEQIVYCPHCGMRFHRWGHVRSLDVASLEQLLARHFASPQVYERFLPAWSTLNWKGRLIAIAKKTLVAIGSPGSGTNLVFVAERQP